MHNLFYNLRNFVLSIVSLFWTLTLFGGTGTGQHHGNAPAAAAAAAVSGGQGHCDHNPPALQQIVPAA